MEDGGACANVIKAAVSNSTWRWELKKGEWGFSYVRWWKYVLKTEALR
jgi:hypothetical protein